MDGWRQAATVEVSSHPGQAYLELWQTCCQACWLLGAISIASFAFVIGILRFALAPLKRMVTLAREISQRRFGKLAQLPWAVELREVVVAMNDMSMKVENMLGEQTQLAENLHKKAYEDSITGLPNFRSLENRLEQWSRSEEEFQEGVLALIHLDNFGAYNARHGREAGDALLRQAADTLRRRFPAAAAALLARGNGAEFAVVVSGLGHPDDQTLGQDIMTALRPAILAATGDSGIRPSVGLARTAGLESASVWLSAADAALRIAQSKGGGQWHYAREAELTAPLTGGNEQWRQLVGNALRDDAFILHFQAVQNITDHKVFHHEVLARIRNNDGSLIPAGLFMPFIRKAGHEATLDRQIVGKLLAKLANDGERQSVAVNLCAASFAHQDFVDWLYATLTTHPDQARRLVIEFAETDLLAEDKLATHMTRVAATGVRFAIDRFGHDSSAIRLLRSLDIAYIKIDGSYIRRIDENLDNQFFVQTLAGIAHGLGIGVIAEYVEDAGEFDTLARLGIDAAQGHFIGQPE